MGFGRQRGYIISFWYGLALTLAMGRAVHRIRPPRPEDRRGIQDRRERRSLIETIKKGWNYL